MLLSVGRNPHLQLMSLFGSDVPENLNFKYTFANLSQTIIAFTHALNLKRFAIYIFDYGAPTGLR